MIRASKNQDGFTLIEVMVAMLIFSFGIVGLIGASAQSAQATFVLEQKMLAGIVADNALVTARRAPLRLGEDSGAVVQMGHLFDYVTRTEKTSTEGFYTLTTTVRRSEGDGVESTQILVQRTAFRGVKP